MTIKKTYKSYISKMIDNLYQPGYLTTDFSDIGFPQDTIQVAFIRESALIHLFFRQSPELLDPSGIIVMPGSSCIDSEESSLNVAPHNNFDLRYVDKTGQVQGHYKYVTILIKAIT